MTNTSPPTPAASESNAPTLLSRSQAHRIRKTLGLTQTQLARVLGLGSSGTRTVRAWETGRKPVSGPVARSLQALRDGWRPADWDACLAAAEDDDPDADD